MRGEASGKGAITSSDVWFDMANDHLHPNVQQADSAPCVFHFLLHCCTPFFGMMEAFDHPFVSGVDSFFAKDNFADFCSAVSSAVLLWFVFVWLSEKLFWAGDDY